MPIYKRCSRCGKRMPAGAICGCQKRRYQEEDKYTKDDKYKLFYKSRSWNRARDIAIDFYGGLDIYSLYVLGRMEYGQTVHHIIPLKECWERRTDVSNLIYLTSDNSQHHDPRRNAEAGGYFPAFFFGRTVSARDVSEVGGTQKCFPQ